ncbi:hypothetical protein [Parvibium lacunae]|uniref:hypothetical protein n=1 Tax=Parvibium lacunae TaxID=1888893 RepID=UPI001314B8B3|nr:hypothetical protein [Parvibium lacunae]
MPVFRLLMALILIAILVAVGAYFLTRQPRYLQLAQLGFRLFIIGGLIFFTILILERVV